MTTTTVTRRTIFGFGANTTPTEDNPGYHFELPKKPDYQGTYKTLTDALETDPYYNSIRNGTYRSESWFVRVNGTWMRVTGDMYEVDDLYRKNTWGEYAADSVEIEIDYTSDAARAAAEMGKAKNERKAAAVRENGKKGGRPRKQ